jgi:hypothetical protein
MNTTEKYADENMKSLEKMAARSHHDLSLKEANETVNDFGRILASLSDSWLFPLAIYPESLLPKSKKIVQEAFALCFKNTRPDSQERHSLYMGYLFLSFFVDDKRACRENRKMLAKPGYWKKVLK